MGNILNIKVENFRLESTVLNERAVRIKGSSGVKITCLTVPHIVKTAYYGQDIIDPDRDLYRAILTEETYTEWEPVVCSSVTLGFGRLTPFSNNLIWMFPRITSLAPWVFGYGFKPGTAYSYWRQSGAYQGEPYVPNLFVFESRQEKPVWRKKGTGTTATSTYIDLNGVGFTTSYAKATSESEGHITVEPDIFGEWETTEDYVLEAIAPPDKDIGSYGYPDFPTIVTGRPKLLVEPYFENE